jgi:hypothetical protein
MPKRRFPPPWSVEEQPACFVLRDASGETIAYVYCEEAAAKLLSKDESFLVQQPSLAGRNTRTVLMRERALTGRHVH